MDGKFVEVKVKGVVKSLGLTSPDEVVPLGLTPSFLLEDDKRRVIAIKIGEKFPLVNEAISGGLTPYNTLVSILERLKVKVNGVLIYDVEENFYAKMYFETDSNKFEEEVEVCDAITISILTRAPIYVDTKTMDEFSADISELIRR
jgi:bifunctional DNase/RNase